MSNRIRLSILAACCAGMMAITFSTAAPSLLRSAIAADLGMSGYTVSGLFLSAPFYGLVLAILASGPLADRWGFRALLVGSAGLLAAGLVMMASAGSPAMVMAGGFVAGLGSGIADALFTPIVCAIYPDRRTRLTNLLHAFYPLGLIVTITLVLLLARAGWSWRTTFALFAGLSLPYGLAIGLLPLPRQSHDGQARMPSRRLFASPTFWLFAGAIFLGALTEITPSVWLPTLVEQAARDSRQAGGLALMLFAVMMAAGRLGGSALVARVGAARLLYVGAVVCVASLLLAAWLDSAVGKAASLSVVGLGVACFWPTLMGSAGDRFPQAGAGMFSFLAAVGNFGGVVGPAALGVVADWWPHGPANPHAGLSAAMAALAIVPLLALATVRAVLGRRQPAFG